MTVLRLHGASRLPGEYVAPVNLVQLAPFPPGHVCAEAVREISERGVHGFNDCFLTAISLEPPGVVTFQ